MKVKKICKCCDKKERFWRKLESFTLWRKDNVFCEPKDLCHKCFCLCFQVARKRGHSLGLTSWANIIRSFEE